jgi:cytochrome c5
MKSWRHRISASRLERKKLEGMMRMPPAGVCGGETRDETAVEIVRVVHLVDIFLRRFVSGKVGRVR